MKPIRVFWSLLGQRFYASRAYKQEGDHVRILGEKFDVTDDIAAAMEKYGITFRKVDASKKEKSV